MIKIPGPNSAPNGDARLVTEKVTRKDGTQTTLREILREKGQLRTGKTRK